MMKRTTVVALSLCVLVGTIWGVGLQARADDLAQAFVRPPDSARPWVYWFWLDGNITREGITADLEAMRRVGIGGVLIMEVAQGIPKGPARFFSPQWRDLFKHMISEAARLGIEVNMNNDAGWCGSGGPWNTPDHAMQKVTWSETRLEGPRKFEGVLPQPPTVEKFYRDIAVLAFPTPEGDEVKMSASSPKVTASQTLGNSQKVNLLIDGNPATFCDLPNPEPGKPQYIQLEFPQPFAARSLTIAIPAHSHRYQGQLQVSDDGLTFKTLRPFAASWPDSSFNFDKISARYYRILFTVGDSRSDRLRIGEVEVGLKYRLENYRGKAGLIRQQFPARAPELALPPELLIGRDRIVDLTARMDKDGRLAWDVPQGNWTVLRLGHTPTGANNAPSPDEGRGLECDKFSREATDTHFAGFMGQLISDVGPAAGKALACTHIDSWEVGSQNWTPKFREEFQRRRGYDPLPYLPAMAGQVVENVEVS